MKGKCPKRGTILVKGKISKRTKDNPEVRCPSCVEHFHQLDQLEWSE
jgi:hypothetical protein